MISIVIPTYNEAAHIASLVTYLRAHANGEVSEIIVSDAGSDDNTLSLAQAAGAMAVTSPRKGRSAQMNYGVSLSSGEILYFLHADCKPPPTFVADIKNAVAEGYELGRYFTRYNSGKTILKINAFFTRFDFFICMGGDQTLFVTRTVFERSNGFKEDMKIMEEYEFCERVRKLARYKIINRAVLISARKYETNSWLRVQLANASVVRMYRKGASQQEMLDTYKRMLNYRKNAF
ncbi:MAG TPA: TIGR04283 family arsenosugar biosynthesis glycosyltransferase [Chitinophagaceae bacterium]|jgi:rSAM/selenodomain-associated transferase 2|nr:TIGR04283 family arsenosugar biosynthesis glycosyltransferase [Chitinophagaceae bacterium]